MFMQGEKMLVTDLKKKKKVNTITTTLVDLL